MQHLFIKLYKPSRKANNEDRVCTLLYLLYIFLAVLMIALILVQHGKGADAGASFGGGGAATVFGASGSGNFLTRLTAVLTALFFVTSLTLAVFAKKQTTEAYSLKTVQTSAPVQTTSPETSPNAPKTGQ
ncbi:preprotein translocase subunit SecG [Acinetobacter seifertii]|nr:preprotein translocase subunit SecG [Acinetobacter seifertii]